jgi:hypothetical protein
VEGCDTWDKMRSFKIGFLGAWQNGILMHYWYRALDRIVSPRQDAFTVLKKICCDEAVFAPQVLEMICMCFWLLIHSLILSRLRFRSLFRLHSSLAVTWQRLLS